GPIAGIISSLLAGFFLSLWVVFGRKSGISRQHYVTSALGYTGFAALWMLLLQPIALLLIGKELAGLPAGYPTQLWLYFIAFVLVSEIIPITAFMKGVKKVQASIAGIILLLEPVSAAVLAAIIFSQPLSAGILFGGALILFSNYLAVKENK
ncbi:EamA family transporter, partial [archaeon]|nr:EamA family transporter [archaeon]